jgi:hypothetical protein
MPITTTAVDAATRTAKQYRGFAQLIDRSLLDGVEEILGPVVERHLCDDVEQCQREGTDGEHPARPRAGPTRSLSKAVPRIEIR